jgi:hypothetical protein
MIKERLRHKGVHKIKTKTITSHSMYTEQYNVES